MGDCLYERRGCDYVFVCAVLHLSVLVYLTALSHVNASSSVCAPMAEA